MKNIIVKILSLLLGLIGISDAIEAQVTIYNSAALTISAGITVTSDANFTNQTNITNGTINNQGSFSITKNWTNNALNNVFTTNAGTTIFSNATAQTIGGTNATTFYNLNINKTSNNVTLLNNNNKITNILTLTAGKIILGANTLIMDVASSVAGTPGVTNSIQADGAGKLQKNFNATGSFTYPIGDADEYSPFTLTLNSAIFGGSDYVSVNVTDAVHPAYIAQDNISRYWTTDAGGLVALNYDVNYKYTDADINGNENNIYAQRYNGSILTAYNVANVGTNSLSSTGGITGLLSNYAFSGEGFFILPVQLIYFKATPQQDKIALQWETATETNNQYYTLEQSLNGTDFIAIAKISASGNTNSLSRYSYDDNTDLQGLVYYRLKQTDIEGSLTYSKIVSVYINQSNNSFTGLFNSQSNTLLINKTGMKNKEAIVLIHNSLGQTLFHKAYSINEPNFTERISFGNKMNTGIYYVTLLNGGKKFTRKIFIH
ncbi:MAG: T9SS type A sorting domain-containing protein [Chitinophagaceae bacterium]